MKAEDIYRMWLEAKKQPTQWQRIYAFARACEQHGIERAKRHAFEEYRGMPTNWSALDAEVAKENEG